MENFYIIFLKVLTKKNKTTGATFTVILPTAFDFHFF